MPQFCQRRQNDFKQGNVTADFDATSDYMVKDIYKLAILKARLKHTIINSFRRLASPELRPATRPSAAWRIHPLQVFLTIRAGGIPISSDLCPSPTTRLTAHIRTVRIQTHPRSRWNQEGMMIAHDQDRPLPAEILVARVEKASRTGEVQLLSAGPSPLRPNRTSIHPILRDFHPQPTSCDNRNLDVLRVVLFCPATMSQRHPPSCTKIRLVRLVIVSAH